MSTRAADAAVHHSPRAVFRRLADGEGGVLLHLDTAGYFGLNDVGCALWEAIGPGGSTYHDLVVRLHATYPDAPASADDELRTFLHELSERGLLAWE